MPECSRSPEAIHQATPGMVRRFCELFVNRRAYTVQSTRPHPESGKHYYYRPTDRRTGAPLLLTADTVGRHLEGEITLALYAINPETQRSKWIAIDADYRNALEDLLRLHTELARDGIEAALEKSRRGAHLWVFFAEPVLSRDARVYVLNLTDRLNLRIKGAAWPEGLEVFPRQDSLGSGEFGNAIRAPLGVHRGANKRYWFYHADYSLDAQFRYLEGIGRVSEERLHKFVSGVHVPARSTRDEARSERWSAGRSTGCEFRILDYVEPRRKVGRNWIARCPSCASAGKDTAGDNLAISVEEPLKYKCWAGCTREMIRAALGRPLRTWRSA